MYIKQAEHMLRTDSYLAAVRYTMKALEINPESIVRNYTNWFFLNILSDQLDQFNQVAEI